MTEAAIKRALDYLQKGSSLDVLKAIEVLQRPPNPPPKWHSMIVRARVCIRRDRPVKPEAEQIDGKIYEFRYGWEMGEGDPYPGDTAWIPVSKDYPVDAPAWIACDDLEEL